MRASEASEQSRHFEVATRDSPTGSSFGPGRLRVARKEIDMRPPSILDVVTAVKRAAPAHGGVIAWWYAPPRRLRLEGERAPREAPPDVEVVVELARGSNADPARIAAELATALRLPSVRVRQHRGAEEPRRLFRIVSAGDDESVEAS
jgi:hypothetical protein